MQAAKNDTDNMPARIHVEGKFNNNKLYKGIPFLQLIYYRINCLINGCCRYQSPQRQT
jgi:hypothetical protein